MGDVQPIELVWERTVQAAQRDVWRGWSDTDRFNRAMNLEMHFEEYPGEDGEVRRQGLQKRFGINITWDERPFYFEAPNWFTVERVMKGGPVESYTVFLKLEAVSPEETRVHYTVSLKARSIFAKPLVKLDAVLSLKPMLTRNIEALHAMIQGSTAVYDQRPPRLSSGALERYAAGLGGLGPRLADALTTFITDAPEHEQARMKPLALAKVWNLEADEVVQGFLRSVEYGLLTLHWDLLCPSCKAPKAQSQVFDLSGQVVHCVACNIRYDASFPDSVEVSFRPDESLRKIDHRPYCLGGPGLTPHFLLQNEIPADGSVDWIATLDNGSYRIRCWPALDAVEVRVSDESDWPDQVTIKVTPDGFEPQIVSCRAGPVKLHITSTVSHGLRVVVESRAQRGDVLTAGQLLSMPGARELLPPDTIAPDLDITVSRRTVLVVESSRVGPEIMQRAQSRVEGANPAQLHLADRALLAVWPDAASAIEGARTMSDSLDFFTAFSTGPVVELARDGRWMPGGKTVEQALSAMRRSIPGASALPSVDLEDAEVARAIRAVEPDVRLVAGPVMGMPTHILAFDGAEKETGSDAFTPPMAKNEYLGSDYKALQRLGRGGFGTVYSARRLADDEIVAVKVLHYAHRRDPIQIQAFYTEAMLASRLNSPHVARLLDFGHTPDGRLFIAMERLEGIDLSDALLKYQTLPVRRTCRMVIDVLKALEEAHGMGLVHRDLKPGNIFLTKPREGISRTVLLDFGVAHDTGGESLSQSMGTAVVGTPKYMSPEHASRVPIEPSSDLYSLALVIYRCITGWVPGDHVRGIAAIVWRLEENIKPLDTVTDRPLPRQLVTAVARALAVKPEDRFQSAAQMRVEIEGALATLPFEVDEDLHDESTQHAPGEMVDQFTQTIAEPLREYRTEIVPTETGREESD